MADPVKIVPDFQSDFSGGENSVTHPALLKANEAQQLINCFPRLGGGLEARRGFKFFTDAGLQGNRIFEMDQSTGTILTHEEVGNKWYDETMSPRYRLFEQTPRTNDAAYFGAREKFGQLVLYLINAYVPANATQGLVYEYSSGSGTWVDFTADVSAALADDKKLAVAIGTTPREIKLSWNPDLPHPGGAAWVPDQVETRTYQYWVRIRVTVDLQNGGSDVVQGQRRLRGSWVGRRHMLTGHTNGQINEWPGLTLTLRAVETPVASRIERIDAAFLNDHLYYASDGQRSLRRWGGSRGTTRLLMDNSPADATLASPNAAPTETRQANVNAYPVGFVIRARISYEHGPEGILGESMPSASREIAAAIAAGGEQITWNISAAVTQAASLGVNAILLYATYDLAGKLVSERDQMGGFLLIRRVVRDSAEWLAGTVVDTFFTRIAQTPIAYTNTPPFYPKYVVAGGERIWIANELFVAWSDIGRGDSWNPKNIAAFKDIRGLLYRGKRCLVAHENDWSYIDLPALGLPDIQYFWRGIGLAQPDSLTVIQDQAHFVSRDGPARIIEDRIEFTGFGRVWQSLGWWASLAGERRLAPAATYKNRIYLGIDPGGSGPAIQQQATLDLEVNDRGSWSQHTFNKAVGTPIRWGTYGVVHCPLDHALARQLILGAFGDGSFTSDFGKLAILDYGTTDAWTTLQTDGVKISTTINTRSIVMKAIDRFKSFVRGMLHLRYWRTASSGVNCLVTMASQHNRNGSTILTHTPSTIAGKDSDYTFKPTDTGGGAYRDTAGYLSLVAIHDTGFVLTSWLLEATIDDFRMDGH